jgi:uncharacterized protein
MSVNFKFLSVVLALAVLCPRPAHAQDAKQTARVCIKDACVAAEIADTDAARMKGLMFRESLAETEGMLFVFSGSARYSFWMMNMRIPLDIIWIDEARRIVDIRSDVQPCSSSSCESMTPRSDARYVLEVPAGFTRRHQADFGDTVTIIK